MTFIHYNQSDKQENTCAYIGTQFIKQDEKEKILQLICSFN